MKGYTLVELLVAASLMILLTSVTSIVLTDAHTSLDAAVERADVQQRARIAIDAIGSHVRRAGAGADHGIAVGPLAAWLPPVRPGRPGGAASEFSSAVTVFATLRGARPATLAHEHDHVALSGASTLEFSYPAGCAPPCGFFDGMSVLLFDGRGDFDLFAVTEIGGTSASVRRLPIGTGVSYARGTPVLPVDVRSYYFSAAAREIRAFDGDRSDVPVVNEVVSVAFEYLGDPGPPVHPRPPAGEENCLFDSTGSARTGLVTLPRADGTHARLSTAMFQDGPWCGGGGAPYDADLLRIRVVKVSVRVQAANAALRGADVLMFRNPGTARQSSRLVKDVTVATSIAPPNLRITR